MGATKDIRARPAAGDGRAPSGESTVRPGGSDSYDLVVIGSGGAAFGAAIKASGMGAKVAMVERATLGGTCVNIGCVPSKTLLRAAEAFHRAQRTSFAGLDIRGALTNFGEVVAQKDALVQELRSTKYADVLGGLAGVTLLEGHGRFRSVGSLTVGESVLEVNRFVIATGARPDAPEIPGLREAGFLTSTTAMELKERPSSLIVLGGRYIALELAQVFARFGSRVTILQRSSHVLPTEDDDLTEALAGYLRDEGVEVLTGVNTKRVGRDSSGYRIEVEIGGRSRILEAEQLLVAAGRRPNSDDLGLEVIGVARRNDGFVVVDDTLQTSAAGVYAAGDVTGEPMFVYTAAYEGALAAENALGGDPRKRDYTALPWVVFTDPQVAGVGLSEKQAKAAGVEVDVATLPLSHLPRAIAARDTRGFIKLLKERGTERLVGARILAPEAGDVIMEAVLAIRYRIPVSEIAAMFHPYLTNAEGMKLAAQAFHKDVSKLSCCAS